MLKRLVLLIIIFVSLCMPAHATIFYLSPSAPDNLGAGTAPGTAWRTFAFALPRLFPGDTLMLVSGTYTIGTTGLMDITCGGAHRNGTAGAPITIKAVSERQAHLSSDGTRGTLHMNACAYWVIEGLRMTTTDNGTISSGSGDNVVVWNGAHHLIFRRNLVQFNNRRGNSHTMLFQEVHNSLLEENEVYSSHRHGILLFGTSPSNAPSFNTLRRNYVNSRSRDDCTVSVPCAGGAGYVSDPTFTGDAGISCYPCNNNIFENNITEDWGAGADIQAKGNARDNRFLGHISLGNAYGGLIFTGRNDWGVSIESMPRLNTVTNYLGCANSIGWWTRGGKDNTCNNCTLMSNTQGVVSDFEAHAPGDGARSMYGSNVLALNNTTYSFNIATGTALFNEIDVFGNGSGANPAIPNAFYTNVITSDPALGTCRVFIPAGSPAKGTGVGGADIGANILYRYQDGALTTSPLWDPTTGAFPCGVQVSGVNNVAGSSCFDVHQRLNVNFNGCTLPGAVVDTAETFYGACPGTGGNCLTAGTACAPQTAWGLMGAEDTLTLANGTYTGDACMINPPSNLHGSAGNRITVKATNAGQVIIDGQNARIPLMIDTNNYWTVEDLNVRNSSFSNVIIQNSTNAILRRVIAWDANSLADANLFVVRTSTDTLLEDVAAWGGGRRCLHLDGSANTTVLRAFFMKNATNQAGPCVTTTGTSTGTTLANIIATVDLSPSSSTAVGNIIGPESYVALAGFTTTTTKLLGSIAYTVAAQNPGVQTALIDGGLPFASIDSGDVATLFTDNVLTLRRGAAAPAGLEFSGTAPRTIIDADHWTDSPVSLPGTQITEGTALGGEGFVSTFDPDLLNSAATSQPSNGAWIKHCYTAAGTIDTGCDLWPWPMNARIQDALITSGRAAQGGLNGAGGTDLTAFIFNQTGSVLTLPLVLAFDIQPVSYVEDTIRPATKVCVYDSSVPALLQTTYATAIVVIIEDNPAAGTLSGTSSVIPTNGCAIYADRSIDNSGVGYSFEATSGALTPVESASFDVIATGVIVVPTVRMLQLK